MKREYVRELVELYNQKSKHSGYQTLAPSVARVLGNPCLDTKSRHESLRLECILSQISIDGATVLDIGGNVGYFTFSAVENGASQVFYFEANENHANFVRTAALALGLGQKIVVRNRVFDFKLDSNIKRFDVCFCLNVLHHIGDDFDKSVNSIKRARNEMVSCINLLASTTDCLVLQIGFNWKGNSSQPLFEYGLKSEMIDFISHGTARHWDMHRILVAHDSEKGVGYSPADANNLKRFDDLGEFLNRPIFFMRARRN